MKESVYCSVTRHEQINELVDSLKGMGFDPKDISVILADNPGVDDGGSGRASEGTTVGAGAGAALGGAFGWMAAIGLVAAPLAGPFLAVGPILAALGGAAVGSAVGGLTGGFIGLGIPPEQAEKYEGRIREGSAVISVHTPTPDQMERVVSLFESAGATDVTRVQSVDAHQPSRTA